MEHGAPAPDWDAAGREAYPAATMFGQRQAAPMSTGERMDQGHMSSENQTSSAVEQEQQQVGFSPRGGWWTGDPRLAARLTAGTTHRVH